VGRLFWKFFSAIQGALLTAGLAVGLVVTMMRPAPHKDLELEAGPHALFMVDTTATLLAHGGVDAVKDMGVRWARSRPGRAQVLVVDTDGHDVLGRSVPAASLERARQVATTEAQDSPPPLAPALLAPPPPPHEVARKVALADGRAFVLFIPTDGEAPDGPGRPPHMRHEPVFLLPLVAGLLASLAFSAGLAWYFAKPVRVLRWAFGAVAEGRLDTRVAREMGSRRDEIADLGRDFDLMVQQLSVLIEAQRRLLHDVSHELRSPLARLQLAIDLARQDPSKLAQTMARIELESQRLDELVGELLTLARLEVGNRDGAMAEIDLTELVESIAEDAHFEAQASNRGVRFQGEPGVVLKAHVELLLRAIENVVRNAVKYTAPGTEVEVDIARIPNQPTIAIVVSDHGPGVPAAHLDAIFEPFYRAENGRAAHGFGLGLAIARRAVEANGGKIIAQNRPEGGLRVRIELPL